MTLILDDSARVWPGHARNLLRVERYHFLPSSARHFGLAGRSLLELRRYRFCPQTPTPRPPRPRAQQQHAGTSSGMLKQAAHGRALVCGRMAARTLSAHPRGCESSAHAYHGLGGWHAGLTGQSATGLPTAVTQLCRKVSTLSEKPEGDPGIT